MPASQAMTIEVSRDLYRDLRLLRQGPADCHFRRRRLPSHPPETAIRDVTINAHD
jgi:hypothetical protein